MAEFAMKSMHRALALLLALQPLAAQNADRIQCIAQIHSEFFQAQRRLQDDLSELIEESQPQLVAVAALNKEFQLKLIQQRGQRFRFLVRRHPGRVAAVQSIMELINLARSWSPGDQKGLLAEDAGYRELDKSIEAVQQRTKSHPDWPALMNFFRTALASEPAFKQAQKRLEAAVARADERISDCP